MESSLDYDFKLDWVILQEAYTNLVFAEVEYIDPIILKILKPMDKIFKEVQDYCDKTYGYGEIDNITEKERNMIYRAIKEI